MMCFAALLHAPVRAQTEQTEIWSAELTVGMGSGFRAAFRGFSSNLGVNGSLSDSDFEWSGNTYTIEDLWWNNSNGQLVFALDTFPLSTELNTWTLQIGNNMFALSRFRNLISDYRLNGAYTARNTPAVGSTLTVRLLAPVSPGIELSPTTVTTDESGSMTEVMVSLMSEPAATVTLAVSSSDEGEATASPSSLVFTPENWDSNQAITVTGVDDDVVDGDQSYTITVSATSDDSAYAMLTATIDGTNADAGDSVGIVMLPPTVTTNEGGSTASAMVSLMSEPAGTVTLTITSSDPAEATASPASLEFTPANWNTAQTFTVTGNDDSDMDGDRGYTITASVTAAPDDSAYATLSATIAGTNVDNDVPNILLDPGNVSTDEGGTTATVMVSLATMPMSEVTLMLSSSNTMEATVSPGAALTFGTMPGAGGWDTAQTFTVTGVNDGAMDGDQGYTITVSATSADSAYGTLTAEIAGVNGDLPEVSRPSRKEPLAETVQDAMAVLDGAGGAQLAADLIARRASPGADVPRASLGGADLFVKVDRAGLSADRETEQESDPFGDRADFGGRRPDVVRTLAGSGFSHHLSAASDGRSFAVWGAGAAVDVGIKVGGDEPEYDGNVFGAQVGVEMRTGSGMAVGVAVGALQGELKVRNSDLRRIEQDMLSLHPYLAWNAGDFEGWLAAGFGAGDYTAVTEDGDRASADASTAMLGAGVGTRWEARGFDLALRASAVGSRSELDEELKLPGEDPIDAKSEFWRLRAELEAGRSFAGDGGAVFRPYVTAGGRQDGGDGPTGGAGELGLGLRFGLDRNLTADLSARVQVTDADLEEKSLSGSLRYDHGADGRGLLLSAGSDRRSVEGDDGTAVHRGRIGYGGAGSVLRRTGRSELYMSGARGDGSRGPRLGAEFDAAPLSLGISGGGGEMRLEMGYRF